jgi:hypothetical protein
MVGSLAAGESKPPKTGAAAKPDPRAERAAFAPAVDARLLFFSIAGGAGDQWFNGVKVNGNRVQAAMAGGKFGLGATVQADNTVAARIVGEPSATDDVQRDLPNGGRTGPYSWGYKQVHAILQQPFLDGGGLKLWGWSYEQAKNAKVRYGAMADSRIKNLVITPKNTLVAFGYTDGGNTILRAHPRNQDTTLDLSFDGGGGGGGKSTWLIELRPSDGEPIGVVACRGTVVTMAYDAWLRPIFGGGAVNKVGHAADFGYADGAGVLMADYGWTKPLLRAHLGKKDDKESVGGMVWAIDADSDSGIMAVSGWMEGSPQGVNAIQTKSGGGKDAFLAIFRLWTPEAAAAAKQAEKDAKAAPKTAKPN